MFGERYIDLASRVPFKRGTVMVKPINLHSVRGKVAQMRVRFFFVPGYISDPQLAACRSGLETNRADDLIDVLVTGKVKDNSGASTISCYCHGSGHPIKAVRFMADEVDERGLGLRHIFLHMCHDTIRSRGLGIGG